MFKAIDREAIAGKDYGWNDLESGDAVGPSTSLVLPDGNRVTIHGSMQLACETVDFDHVRINFDQDEKILLAPFEPGRWTGTIWLEFQSPVEAAGVQLGVINRAFARPFLGLMRAVSHNGTVLELPPVRSTSFASKQAFTEALFLGVIAKEDEGIKSLEFDVDRIPGEAAIFEFAINRLTYRP